MNNLKHDENIHQLLEQFIAAWNIHDAQAFSNLFSEDADFTNVFGQTFHGRDAVEKQHAGVFATILKHSSFAIINTSIRFLTNELAATDVVWTMSGATLPNGNAWPDRKGLMNLIIKQEEAGCKILIMHNMDLPSQPK